jgi:phosphoribosyl-dephospho-CoA transferase
MNELEAAKKLINEASQKMSAAIESKNMQSAKVAQMMLQTGNEKLQLVSKRGETVRNKQKTLRRKLEAGCIEDAPACKKKTNV